MSRPAQRPASRLGTLRRMIQLARQRHQLANLDRTRLEDLGLTSEQAHFEANRPFWDAPRAWRG
ncbi:MAG: hypothetical protein KJZ59_00820 [Pararhodobacter sp.]|nr:hypothetical protein [Pararhodobacter sp.]